MKNDTSEIRTEGRAGIYGNYPQAFGNYFFGRLSDELRKSGLLSETQAVSNMECGVKLIEVNEANADGVLSWIYKKAWALSEVSCTAKGRELKRTVKADTSDIFLKHNAVAEFLWRSRTIPATSPVFQNTPVGITLNDLAAMTHKAMADMGEVLSK
ncbi:MAG: hypothetical protein EPN22_09635 [Nitrospirae bacterium]|nr:MAG: hypothetical protein EPN22_09635 [Nitrospirota bacterium]